MAYAPRTKDPRTNIDRFKYFGGAPIPAMEYSRLSEARNIQQDFPRLSRPVPLMRPEYDIVIIGSGYGAGVAASRMARTGKTVAVLELGEEKWPGEYPITLKDASREFHLSDISSKTGVSKPVELGKKTGLYNLVIGEGQSFFSGNGLGGTSLINANVFLEADNRTLQLRSWPTEIRESPDLLDPYYRRAAQMLSPTPYPETYPQLKKLSVLEMQAEALGQKSNFYRVPQTTFFHNGPNSVGVQMSASTGSGQDCTGINDGSKNTVLATYLADAWNWGAEMFCECEVRFVQEDERGKGYIINFIWHGSGREAFKNEYLHKLMWVRAKELCILGAGTVGTTAILLRSQERGLSMSPLVGQKISGNGDILEFSYNSDEIINGMGTETPSSSPPGPTITGIIDARGAKTSPNVLDGYVIEEGAIPAALASVLQALLEATPGKTRTKSEHIHLARQYVSSMKSKIFGSYTKGGSMNRTQTYLIMSHDNNEAMLTMEGDKPHLKFVGVAETKQVRRLHEVLVEATRAIGGTLVDNPFYAFAREEISVHPLGGAIMSFDGTGRHGAVDHMGRVFTGEGSELHHGLLCVDAAVIPTALGVNPLATITALAERSCELLIRERGWEVDAEPNGSLNLFGKPKRSHPLPFSPLIPDPFDPGVRFTESMDGYLHIGNNITDFEAAYSIAKGAASTASLFITVDTFRSEKLQSLTNTHSLASGTFSCGAVSQHPLQVLHGEVQFFTVNEQTSDGKNLKYNLTLLSVESKVYHLRGYKKIDASIAFSVRQTWKATTTLYTEITNEDGSIVGRGILKMSWGNFKNEMRSFKLVLPNRSRGEKISNTLNFCKSFMKEIGHYFFAPCTSLQFPDIGTAGYFSKPSPQKIAHLEAEDGVKSIIKIWEPPKGVRRRQMPILFLPGASVDDQIFSLPTIPTNTIDFFTSLGYTCYVSILRFGILPAAQLGCTAFDARLDVKAAMEFVRREEKDRKFYVICHCLGSIATGFALLTGTVDANWIQGMTCSQVFTNLRFGKVNRIKASSQMLEKIYEMFAGSWFPTDSTPNSSVFQRFIDQLLRFYPVGSRSEICHSTVCHRESLVFGRLWTHSNLNHATHAHLSTFFGGIHMSFLSHLTLMGSTPPHHLRSNQPEFTDLVTSTGNLERLKGLKIQFLSGGANVVWDPWSTSESYDMLRHKFGSEYYTRVVVPGYGHLDTWMGKDSYRDVYPRVQWHVELCE